MSIETYGLDVFGVSVPLLKSRLRTTRTTYTAVEVLAILNSEEGVKQ